MLYNHFTEELLGLQGVKITNVEQEENLIIHLEMERKRHNCICCGTATDTIHDYRLQKIKDIPAFGKKVGIMLRKRRYRCPHWALSQILCKRRNAVKTEINILPAAAVNPLSPY